MAAVEGKLTIGSRSYEVYECDYEFTQALDQTGKPTTRTRGGQINLVLRTTGDDDILFYEWMFRKSETKSGEIEIILSGEGEKKVTKSVHFADAFCVKLKDCFDSDSKNAVRMTTKVTLSAEKIHVGGYLGAVYSNDWEIEE